MLYLKSFELRRFLFGGLLLLIAIWPTVVRGQFLQNGEEVFSSISTGGTASFDLSVDAGSTVVVNVGETGVVLPAQPRLRVFAPDGNQVAIDNLISDSSAFVQFAAVQTGTYTAIVSDELNDQSMEFNIVASGISDDLPAILGDVNGDGSVDFLDISPFISVLSTGDYLAAADINRDGVVNFLDISPFIALLSS